MGSIHLECGDCFWAFNDYAADRTAWGYTYQPATAALRERLLSLKAPQVTRAVRALPEALSDFLREAAGRQEVGRLVSGRRQPVQVRGRAAPPVESEGGP